MVKIAGCLALTGVGIDCATAYERTAVADGGALMGTVTLSGKVPAPKGYSLTTLPDQVYCGRISDGRGWRLFQPFDVGDSGVFRQVVVYIESISKGETFLGGDGSRFLCDSNGGASLYPLQHHGRRTKCDRADLGKTALLVTIPGARNSSYRGEECTNG